MDKDRVFKSLFISSKQTLSITKGSESVKLSFSESDGTSKVVPSERMVHSMGINESTGHSSLRVDDQEKTNTAVCYLTVNSDFATFDI